jgi:hypothetical protein
MNLFQTFKRVYSVCGRFDSIPTLFKKATNGMPDQHRSHNRGVYSIYAQNGMVSGLRNDSA